MSNPAWLPPLNAVITTVSNVGLELADLVARLEQPREVVALYPQLDPQLLRESLELEQRGGNDGELDPRDRRRARHHGSHYLRRTGRQARNRRAPGARRPTGRGGASSCGRSGPGSRGCCC